MPQVYAAQCLDHLRRRKAAGGGFAVRGESVEFRADATAWAALALRDHGSQLAKAGRRRLAEMQLDDGRLAIDQHHREAYWPTAVALLAWHGDTDFSEASKRAVQFLLTVTGTHYVKPATSPMGHDTSLRGWAWSDGTHSWVEPTSLALMALALEEQSDHPRSQEGLRLLVDRQLSSGGWNYGNTTVFGTELRALPYATGMALSALAGRVDAREVQPSLEYLQEEAERIRSPLSLAWSILGLSAWGMRPPDSEDYIGQSLERAPCSALTTTLLSLILLAHQAASGLPAFLRRA